MILLKKKKKASSIRAQHELQGALPTAPEVDLAVPLCFCLVPGTSRIRALEGRT